MTIARCGGADLSCCEHIQVRELLRYDSLPMYRTADGVVVATALDILDRPLLSNWFPSEKLIFLPVGRRTVQDMIISVRPDEVADEMANAFTVRHPESAARTGIARWQKAVACCIVVAAAGTLATGGSAIIAAAISSLFCAAVLFKILLAIASTKRPTTRTLIELPDDKLPAYTVLIPAYHEEAVIGETVKCVANLDYPKDKLEVLVLVERRDEATARAVREADPPHFVRVVLLPPGPPQTKPRSCSLGLMLARGELLVIFDAEDRPERDQLRKAANHFAAGGEQLACVQARLNFYNRSRNLLTRMFSLEYAFWFDLMLVGLDRLKLPIPLGGTSNHIRTGILRDVGGWDAWNVTEDADLGLRLASKGYRVEVLDSTTWEECPARPWAWIMQRTRWLKGYLLTLLVHTRRPADALRCFGVRGMVSLVGVVAGTPLVFLLWPFAFVAGLLDDGPFHVGGLAAEPTLAASAAMWSASMVMVVPVVIAAYRRHLTWVAAVLIPLYWLLHAFAAWRGLLQLIRAPYRWEKTAHSARSAADPQ